MIMKTMDKPHLTLVDSNHVSEHDREFIPLPYYPWEERPHTLPLDPDECATAIHLAHGSLDRAASLLKVEINALNRMVRKHPMLQRIQSEALDNALAKAQSYPIDTLFDPNTDRRAKEWATAQILKSRLAMGSPLSPAPAGSATSNVTINQDNREIVFTWRSTPPDNSQTLDSSYLGGDNAENE